MACRARVRHGKVASSGASNSSCPWARRSSLPTPESMRSGQPSPTASAVRISGRPICARVEPSSNSTSACTRLCGCTTTSMRSAGRPNRWWASMTSRPLFISVAESTEIFGPIDHLGWATACSGVTASSSARLRPRNGPPEAVRVIARTPRCMRPSGRHWKMALCSLSIGITSAPASRAEAITSSPASTRDSLLASSRRLPDRAAARVESSPAAPTIAATTVLQASEATSSASTASPAWARVGSPDSSRPSRRAWKRV